MPLGIELVASPLTPAFPSLLPSFHSARCAEYLHVPVTALQVLAKARLSCVSQIPPPCMFMDSVGHRGDPQAMWRVTGKHQPPQLTRIPPICLPTHCAGVKQHLGCRCFISSNFPSASLVPEPGICSAFRHRAWALHRFCHCMTMGFSPCSW